MIGQQRERNVVRSLAAVSGEKRCVTTLKTAARETILSTAIRYHVTGITGRQRNSRSRIARSGKCFVR